MPAPPNSRRPLAGSLALALLTGLVVALGGAPSPRALAGPGDASPSPAPGGPAVHKDELDVALEKVHAIATVDTTKGEALVVKFNDPRFEAVRKAAINLAKGGDAKVVAKLIDRLEEHHDNIFVDHAVHMAYRNALVEVPQGSKGEAELEKRLQDHRAWKKQVALCWTLRKRAPSATLDGLLKTLAKSKEAKVFVQSAAIRALGTRRAVDAVAELIDIMAAHDETKDGLWLDARMALWEATGYDRPTPKAWRELWAEKGKGFDPDANRGGDPPWRLVLGVSRADHTVPGEKVCICIDTSGSLHVRDAAPGAPIPTTSTATTSARCPDCGVSHWPGCDGPIERQRLAREKVAVQTILTGLRPKSSKFQLVRFDTAAHALNSHGVLLEVSLHNIENARDFLAPVEATGVTKMVRGLDEAFACEDMDVLYLLTDGAPTGDVPNTIDAAILDEVVAEIRVLNRFKGVRIFPIGFRQYPAPLLELVANEQHGSVFYID